MFGALGTGVMPSQIASTSGNNLSFTDNLLAVNASGYYYADITIAGNRTVTSPIWYTKTTPLPVTLVSFKATLNTNRTVQLNWQTVNEINNAKFVVEKSFDGISFKTIREINAQKEKLNNYSLIDESPAEGINYYRLKQVDIDGKFTYTNIVSVNLNSSTTNSLSIVENPVSNVLKLKINSSNSCNAKLIITDVYGRTVKTTSINLVKGFQTQNVFVNDLPKETYYISLISNNEIVTDKFIVL